MIKSILNYQKKDGELVAIEKEIAESKAKKVVNQIVSVVKKAQQKLVQAEKEADRQLEKCKDFKKQIEDQTKLVEKLAKSKLNEDSKDELDEFQSFVLDSIEKLINIEKEVAKMRKESGALLTDFEQVKQATVDAKKKYNQGMEAYNKLVESKAEKVKKIEAELKALEKDVDPKYLAKYKKMRGDKIFPVYVPLLDHSCGGCLMELSLSQINKLEENGVLECENCHRIIYK